MSIIRFSCIKADLHAPKADGGFVDAPYDPAAQAGMLGTLGDPAALDLAIDRYLDGVWNAATAMLPAEGPVVILINGFMFNPHDKVVARPASTDNPHSAIFHFTERPTNDEARAHDTGWPIRLKFAENDAGKAGLAIAFGWFSSPGPKVNLLNWHENFYADACGLADASAPAMTRVLAALVRRSQGREIDIFAHSMGTWLATKALLGIIAKEPGLVAHLGRIVLLGGSAYRRDALALAQRVDAGGAAGPEVYNFMNGADDVLRKLARRFGPSRVDPEPVIGFDGLGQRFERWLSLDDKPTQQWVEHNFGNSLLAELDDGVLLDEWADHWAYFAHDGNMAVMAKILRERAARSIAALRDGKILEVF